MSLSEIADSIMKWIFSLTEKEIIIYLAIAMIISGILTFLYMTVTGQRATYGRYQGDAFLNQFAVNPRVAWFLQEAPSLILPCIALAYFGENLTISRFIAFAMFTGHYWNRTLIFPFLINGGKPTPPHLWILGVVFCLWNGYIQGFYHIKYADFSPHHPRDLISQFGIAIFFLGMFINIHSDSILRNLRKPGETGYKIPQGGMFEFVSGANFLGEILEWTGYAIYCRTLPALAFAIFTASNIGPRAYHHHQWYLTKFEDYPKERTAVVPLLL
jgi:3-oxo-5-alpha-steroid 4-dehydrogenase 1